MEHPTIRASLPIRGPSLKPRFFDLRRHSLLRASLLAILSLPASVLLSHFPNNRATPLLILPVITAILGTADTVRCLQRRWSFYHGGVLLCLYMDSMILAMVIFFLVYPYFTR